MWRTVIKSPQSVASMFSPCCDGGILAGGLRGAQRHHEAYSEHKRAKNRLGPAPSLTRYNENQSAAVPELLPLSRG